MPPALFRSEASGRVAPPGTPELGCVDRDALCTDRCAGVFLSHLSDLQPGGCFVSFCALRRPRLSFGRRQIFCGKPCTSSPSVPAEFVFSTRIRSAHGHGLCTWRTAGCANDFAAIFRALVGCRISWSDPLWNWFTCL